MGIATQLRLHEGLRLNPYRCSEGKLTIGYGRNLEGRGISKQEAELLLQNDIANTIREINARFHWFARLSKNRQDVIIDMVFNLGIVRFTGFRNTINAIELGNYWKAAYEMKDSKWADQVGRRADRLALMMEFDINFDEALERVA